MQQKTKEEKEELVQLYKQSGMSVRAFAQEFDLNLATFRNWLYKKTPENKPADDNCSFVEVEVSKVKQYLAIKNASTRWTMSIKDWGLAVNQFAILFDGRVPGFN